MTHRTPVAIIVGAVLLLSAWSFEGPGAAAAAGDAAARVSAADDATEYWEVTARFDGGYRLFTRFGITNEGPGVQTAGAIWYLVQPDGRVMVLKNGREQGNWKLSPDHLRLDIASSSLDLHAPLRRLAIDSTSQHAKIALQFPATDVLATSPAGEYQIAALQLSTPIDGTIWVRGMRTPMAVHGTVTLTHAWSDDSLPRVMQRQIEVVAGAPDLTLYLSDITTPAGTTHPWLVVQRGDATAYNTTDREVSVDADMPAATHSGYPLASQLSIRDQKVRLDVRTERLLLRVNPLDVVPQPFRLLFAIKIAPQWIWADASFHLTLSTGSDTPPIEAEGRGTVAVNFMNPLSPPQ